MNISRSELYFFSLLLSGLGLIYWQPAYLDFDSRFDGKLQLQVFINYLLLVVLIIPFYIYTFKARLVRPPRQAIKTHLFNCPLYILLWFFAGRKIYQAFGGTYVYGNRFQDDFYRNELYCDVYLPMLIYILFFISTHIYHYSLQQQALKKREKALIKEANKNEINLLKANIQPLFLSRALRMIGKSIPQEHIHTQSLIDKLTQLISFSLEVSGKEKIRLEEEIKFIKNYLALEQERFKNKINTIYNISEESFQLQIPPMLIQPIIENAVKHGIEKNTNHVMINVSIHLQGGFIHVSISDTGKGIEDCNYGQLFKRGTGLGNTRQRMIQLFNEKIKLSPNIPRGLSVSYKIPYDQ